MNDESSISEITDFDFNYTIDNNKYDNNYCILKAMERLQSKRKYDYSQSSSRSNDSSSADKGLFSYYHPGTKDQHNIFQGVSQLTDSAAKESQQKSDSATEDESDSEASDHNDDTTTPTANTTSSSKILLTEEVVQQLEKERNTEITKREIPVEDLWKPSSGSSSCCWRIGILTTEKNLAGKTIKVWECFKCQHKVRAKKENGNPWNTNIMRHLYTKHNYMSINTDCKNTKAARVQSNYEEHDAIRREMKNDKRFHRLLVAKEIATTNTPLRRVEDPDYRAAYRYIPGLANYSYLRLKWHIIEWYASSTDYFAENLKKVKSSLGNVPFLCCNYDLWTNQPTSDIFVGVHIFYVDQEFQKQGMCLGFKNYSPYSDLRDTTPKSQLLLRWLEYILHEYGLSLNDIHSSCTDKGSDVHCCLANLLPEEVKNYCEPSIISAIGADNLDYATRIMWIWCLPHLLNKALQEACGTKYDDGRVINEACYYFIKMIQKEIEHNRKSYKKKDELRDLQFLEYECIYATELRNVAPQRWSSLVDVMRRFLKLWPLLRAIQEKYQYATTSTSTFDYTDGNHLQLMQLYSLLVPVNDIIVAGQNTKDVVTVDVFSSMIELYNNTLNEDCPLRIINPTNDSNIDLYWQTTELTDTTILTRQLLSTAVCKRFWDTYVDKKDNRSYLYDLALTMCPFTASDSHSLQTLLNNYIPTNANVTKITYDEIMANTWKILRSWAIRLAWGQGVGDNKQLFQISVSNIAQDINNNSSSKRHRTIYKSHYSKVEASNNNIDDNNYTTSTNTHNRNNNNTDQRTEFRLKSVCDTVDNEIAKYKQMLTEPEKHDIINFTIMEKPLAWWFANKANFPILAELARIIYGNTISSAAQEVSFSKGGLVYSPIRNQLKAGMVDILASLYVNKTKLPNVSYVKKLSEKEATERYNRVFRGARETMELVAGEVREDINGRHLLSDDNFDENKSLRYDID